MVEIGENVICKIKKILPYGVFVEIVETGQEGFVHISQVESGWIKNIRKVVKEGEMRVGRVMVINKDRKQIDISFTKVSKLAERSEINDWKKRKKINMLMEVISKEKKKSLEEAWEKVAEPLIEKYGDFDNALKNIASEKEKGVECIDKTWRKVVYDILSKSAQTEEKTIKRIYEIKVGGADGLNKIKKMFEKVPEESESSYIGGGQYLIEIKGMNVKKVDEKLTKFEEELEKEILKAKGSFKKVKE